MNLAANSFGACRICASSNVDGAVPVREMMFGTQVSFDYILCVDCGTLQIAEVPEDLGSYYGGATYYYFNNNKKRPLLKRLVKTLVARWIVGRPDRFPVGSRRWDFLRRLGWGEAWIATVPGLNRQSTILDVGCGDGERLANLATMGFSSLSGVDPFLPADMAGPTKLGIRLFRGRLSDFEDRFDVIMMHNSLEHVDAPGEQLRIAAGRLRPNGHLVVRIPVFQRKIWQEYGADWAQIDAPRHLNLFSIPGFISFASRHGLECIAHGCDGRGWSLAWSEAFRQGVSMYDADGTPNALPFGPARLRQFEERARELNRSGEADQAFFVFKAA